MMNRTHVCITDPDWVNNQELLTVFCNEFVEVSRPAATLFLVQLYDSCKNWQEFSLFSVSIFCQAARELQLTEHFGEGFFALLSFLHHDRSKHSFRWWLLYLADYFFVRNRTMLFCISSVDALTELQKQQLKKRLQLVSGASTVMLIEQLDPSLIAGCLVKTHPLHHYAFGMDATVAHHIDLFSSRLLDNFAHYTL